VAALNISANAGRVVMKQLRERFVPLVIRSVATISADLTGASR
jgi:hypothetical protein